jgi:HlyD family secretion protein
MKAVHGDAPWPVRRYVLSGLLALFILGAGFGSWAVLANISGAIITTGRIQEARTRQVIQHPQGGVVAQVLVREGDSVAADAPLIVLDDQALQSELNIVEIQMFEMMARHARLQAERDQAAEITFEAALTSPGAPGQPGPDTEKIMAGQRRLFAARNLSQNRQGQALARKTRQIEIQISGMNVQLTALDTQLSLVSDQLANQQVLLERGLAQASAVLSLKREAASLQGRIGALGADRAEALERITGVEIEGLRAQSARREQAIARLRDIELRENELAERRQALRQRLDGLVVRAPSAGVVLGLQVGSAGAVIKAAQALMQIIPQDRAFVITTRIAPMHVDQIYPGQPVRLNFATLDQGATPDLSGTVARISADALVDARSQTAYYSVEIALSDAALTHLSARSDILPGMPVEAYFLTTRQPAWAYLVRPLAAYFSRAFRES